jgi:hypothetical protein
MSAAPFPPFRLVNDDVRKRATAAVWRAPEGWYCRITPPTRTLDQNALLHARLADIVKSDKGYPGLTLDDHKVLFMSAWMIEAGKHSEVVKGIHGEAVQLRRSTTTLSKSEFSELMIIIERYCAERGIKLRGDDL